MSIHDEIVEVADQTADERVLLPDAVELVRAPEQLVLNGRQKLRARGRGGERT